MLAIWQTVFAYIPLPAFHKIASELMFVSLALCKRKMVSVKTTEFGQAQGTGPQSQLLSGWERNSENSSPIRAEE